MKRSAVGFLALLVQLAACGHPGDGAPPPRTPLSADDLNLIFVVSPDLAYQTPGDIDADTASLTSQGLQRSLLMATWLKQRVMGGADVSGIYALSPMTHLQGPQGYPDMAAIGFVQQFALLNQVTLPISASASYTANSFPIGASYGPGSVPAGVAVPAWLNTGCQGLAFDDAAGDNAVLVDGIIQARAPGFHVFSAPWETTSALLQRVVREQGLDLALPSAYQGTNVVYALSIAPSGAARLTTLDSQLAPLDTFPVLPAPVATASCVQQPFWSTTRIGGVGGAVVPAGINTNQRLYIIRHAEAHPDPGSGFEDGNLVGAGQWRALDLPRALRGKISPDVVYSVDPAQSFPALGTHVSYVRPSLTVLPYAIANHLPYFLVSDYSLLRQDVAQLTSDFFFTGGRFSGHTVLLAWESSRIKPLLGALLESYGAAAPVPDPAWPHDDYDTVWTVTLDAEGNATVSCEICEGIDSAALPAAAPPF